MAISFIGAQGAAATTVTIPTHQIGDLILIFAYRDGSNTAPTTPAAGGTVPTWNLIGSSGGNTNSSNFRWAKATATTTTSGTWTNATELICLVYRKASIGASVGGSGAATTTVNYPALTLNRTDGSSWVVGVAGHRTANNVDLAPGAMVNRASSGTEAAGHDTNGGVTTWASTNVTVNASSAYRSWVVELEDTELELVSNTGAFTLSGVNVDFAKSVSLDINAGTFTLAGTTTGLLFDRNLIQQLGTFSLAGNNAILLNNRTLDTSVGTYSLAGNPLDPNVQRAIIGNTGTFDLAGNNSLLQRQVRIDATSQTYDLDGTSTTLAFNRALVGQTGPFTIAGIQVDLVYTPSGGPTFTLDQQTGTFAIAGVFADLSKQVSLDLQVGTYSLFGNTLGFIRALALHSVPGSFSVSGKDAVFSLTKRFNLTTGTYNVSGNNAEVNRFYQLNNQPGTYQVVGSGLDYFSTRNLVTLPLNIVTDFRSVGNFFWYQTTQTIQPVKYRITKRNEFILGRQTHMGRRGL